MGKADSSGSHSLLECAKTENGKCVEFYDKVIWNTQDSNGNEKYCKSKSKEKEKTFFVGSIPVTVRGGVTGELGVRGNINVAANNRLILAAGPYAMVTGFAEGSVGGWGFNAGIGIELVIIELAIELTPSIQILPSIPAAVFQFETPLVLRTLDGRFYAFLKTWWDRYEYTILEWDGLEWSVPLFDPYRQFWLSANRYGAVYSDTDGNSAIDFTDAISYNWGTGSPDDINSDYFSASWEGSFEFEPGTYVFKALADDYIYASGDIDGDGFLEPLIYQWGLSRAKDFAGNNDGTVINATMLEEDKISSSDNKGLLSLDGDGDYIQVPGGEWFNDDFTIEAWVYVRNYNKWSRLLDFGNGEENNNVVVALSDGETGYPVFAIHRNGTSTRVTSYKQIPLNEWTHIAVAFNRIDNTLGSPYIYMNRSLVAAGRLTPPERISRQKNYIGKSNWDSDAYADAKFDEIRIWNKRLYPGELSMNRQLSGDEEGLVLYYRFDYPDLGITQRETDPVTFDSDTLVDLHVDYEENEWDAYIDFYWENQENNVFNVSYFNNTELSGYPVCRDTEKEINHNWSFESPGEDVNADYFSARWEGDFEFDTAGNYVFAATVDDGIRVYVDGELLIDKWFGQAPTLYTAEKYLGAGAHSIVVEYFELEGWAVVNVDWQLADQFYADYYKDDGSLINENPEVVSGIDYDGLVEQKADYFKGRWEGMINFDQAGVYNFVARFLGGMKIWVDGEEYLGAFGITDRNKSQIFSLYLSEGYHLIEAEHYNESDDNGSYIVSTIAQVSWFLQSINQFTGYYYLYPEDMAEDDWTDEDNYAGTEPEYIFVTDGIEYNWTGFKIFHPFPIAAYNDGSFAVRWIGDFEFSEGIYEFTAAADDGVRMWVDNALIMDQWNTVSDTVTYREAVFMEGGIHNIRIEYWNDSGDADISISWYNTNNPNMLRIQ